ncbi:MAG: DUF6252 family protein [Chitinophagaceae bacterium]
MIKYVIAALCLVLINTSCKKKNDDPVISVNDTTKLSSSFSANIGSRPFKATDFFVSVDSMNGLIVQGSGMIGTSSAQIINLSVKNFHGATEYTIKDDTRASYSDAFAPFIAETGTIIVSKFDSLHVKGQFSFEAKGRNGQQSISLGYFDLVR